MKSFTITDEEILDHSVPLQSTNELVLRLLKKKGAPIVGVVILKVSPDYDWIRNVNIVHATQTWTFTKKEEQNV